MHVQAQPPWKGWLHARLPIPLAAGTVAIRTRRHACAPQPLFPCTAGGALIGGYHPLGWSGQGGDSDSEDAFLFFLDDDTDQMVKLEKVGGLLCQIRLQ